MVHQEVAYERVRVRFELRTSLAASAGFWPCPTTLHHSLGQRSMRLQMPNLPPITIRDLGRLYRLDIDPLRRESSDPFGCIRQLHPKHRQEPLLKFQTRPLGFLLDGVRGRVGLGFLRSQVAWKGLRLEIAWPHLPCPWPPAVRPSGCRVAHLKQLHGRWL